MRNRTAADLVSEARARIVEATPEQARDALPGSIVIDVREPAEYASGHIEGAVNIPRGVLEFEVAAHPAFGNVTDPALADRTAPILLYCRSGGRAALAARALDAMGFTRVRSVEGGIQAWIEAGFPVSMH